MSREDLEDEYLRLLDQNVVLKKTAGEAEQLARKLSTQVKRLTAAKDPSADAAAGRANTEAEEKLRDAQTEIDQLNAANEQLRNKMSVLQQQVAEPSKRHASVAAVKSRLETGAIVSERPKPSNQAIVDELRRDASAL